MVDAARIALRPACDADAGFLYALYSSTRDDLRSVNLPPPQIEALIEMQFTAQRTSYEAWFPGSEHSIVLLDGQPAGRIWVARLEGQIRIIDVAMMPECRNLGVGSHVFSRFMRESEQSGTPLRTSVQKFNFGSLRFHSRLGFRPVGEDPVSYEMEWR